MDAFLLAFLALKPITDAGLRAKGTVSCCATLCHPVPGYPMNFGTKIGTKNFSERAGSYRKSPTMDASRRGSVETRDSMHKTHNTDAKYRQAKPADKEYTLADANGLTMLVHPNGSKYWFVRYSYQAKRHKLNLGRYPDVPLRGYVTEVSGEQAWVNGARDIAADVCRKIAAGIDPKAGQVVQMKERKKTATPDSTSSTTGELFREVAEKWYTVQAKGWSESNQKNVLQRIRKDILPTIGNMRIDAVTAEDALAIFRTISDRGSDVLAIRVLEYIERILRFKGLTPFTIPILREQGHIVNHRSVRNHPARVRAEEFAQLLRVISSDTNREPLRLGLRLLALTFFRPGAMQLAEWKEIDLFHKMWVVPGEKKGCKRKVSERSEPHYIPLSRQAIEILTRLKELAGESKYVFPSRFVDGHAISNAAFGVLLKDLGYKDLHTPHGFRASAMTIMMEELDVAKGVIDIQLGHAKSDKNGTAYDRAEYINKRRFVMQQWADYIDRIVAGDCKLQAIA